MLQWYKYNIQDFKTTDLFFDWKNVIYNKQILSFSIFIRMYLFSVYLNFL